MNTPWCVVHSGCKQAIRPKNLPASKRASFVESQPKLIDNHANKPTVLIYFKTTKKHM